MRLHTKNIYIFEMELNLCSNASQNKEDTFKGTLKHNSTDNCPKDVSKIHPLGNPQSKNRTLSNQAYRIFPVNYRSYCQSVKIGQPISLCIPQTDIIHLMKQLEDLKSKYLHLQKNVEETSIYEKKICDDVANITKNFQLQLSRVVNESRVIQKDNNHELEELKCIHVSNCDNMLQTLKEASAKMQELEERNERLSRQLGEEKQKNERIMRENEHLLEKIRGIESGKENIIQGIKGELDKLSHLRLKESQYKSLSQNHH